MKKIFSPIMATAFALMLTNCSNNDIVTEQPVQPTAKKISLKADIVGSKLSMADDYKMTWEDGDKIGVYIMNGSTVVCANEPFEYDAATKTFTGNVALEDATTYKWAAVYPYSNQGGTKVWTKAPMYSSESMINGQAQKGNDDKKHLVGFDLMASGVVSELGSDPVHLVMNHQTSIICLNIKNGSEDAFTPTSLTFSIDGVNVGARTVYYNFDDGSISTSASTSENIILNYTNATSVAANGTFKAYFIMLPNNVSGASMNVSVSDGTSNYISAPKDLTATFVAGNYYTSDVTLTKEAASTALYETGFEDTEKTGTTNSYGADIKTYTSKGVSWDLKYADVVSTGKPISGGWNVMARIAKNTTNTAIIESGNLTAATDLVSTVKFKMNGVVTLGITMLYSFDNGATWATGGTFDCSSTAVEQTININQTGAIKIKFEVFIKNGSSTTSNREARIDDLIVE